jgi:hypothetical protein
MIQQALLGIVPPALIALVLLIAAWRPWSKEPPPARWGAAGSALALAVAYFVTERVLVGNWSALPPLERYRWLPYLGFAAAAGAIAFPRHGSLRWGIHDVIALGAFVLLSWRLLNASQGSAFNAGVWILLSVFIASSIRSDAEGVAPCGVRVPLTWWVACAGTAVVFLQSSEVAYAQLMGAMAAVMGAFVVIGAWRREFEIVRGMSLVFAVLFVGLVLVSTGMRVQSAVLVLLAASTPALGMAPFTQKLRPWMTTVLGMVLAAVLCVGAVWFSPQGFNFSSI